MMMIQVIFVVLLSDFILWYLRYFPKDTNDVLSFPDIFLYYQPQSFLYYRDLI